MSGKFLSVDSNWLSAGQRRLIQDNDAIEAKGKGRVEERHWWTTQKDYEWQEILTVLTGYSLQLVPWTFPQDVGGPVPFRLLHQWNFKSSRDRVNWVHFGRVAYPCARQLGARNRVLLLVCDYTRRPPWCEGGIPRKGWLQVAFQFTALKPGWRALRYHRPRTHWGGRDLTGEDVRFAQFHSMSIFSVPPIYQGLCCKYQAG